MEGPYLTINNKSPTPPINDSSPSPPLTPAKAHIFREQRTEEISRIQCLRRVSSSYDEDCPVCLSPFPEQSYPMPRIPRGGFECNHAVCYDCNLRLLKISATTIQGNYRCPLCRADGIGEEHAPAWLLAQLNSQEVTEAREEAERRRADEAPLALRRAAMTAAEQVGQLLRLMEGDESMARIRRAVQEASDVLVEVGGDEMDRVITGEIQSDLERELEEEVMAEEAARERTRMLSIVAEEASRERTRMLSSLFHQRRMRRSSGVGGAWRAAGSDAHLAWADLRAPTARALQREADREAQEEAAESVMGTSGARLEAFMAAVARAFNTVEGELNARVDDSLGEHRSATSRTAPSLGADPTGEAFNRVTAFEDMASLGADPAGELRDGASEFEDAA